MAIDSASRLSLPHSFIVGNSSVFFRCHLLSLQAISLAPIDAIFFSVAPSSLRFSQPVLKP